MHPSTETKDINDKKLFLSKNALSLQKDKYLTVSIPKNFASLSINNKILQIQQSILQLSHSYPDFFDTELLREFEHFKIFSPSLFWEFRSWKHLCRLIITNYLLKQTIKRHCLLFPEKRHLFFRFLPSKLLSPFGEKSVLGVAITIRLFDKFEHFDEEHVLFTVQKRMPTISLVKGSKILYRNPQEENLCLLYLELDKEQGIFSLLERKMLKKILERELKDSVQKLVPFLFTVRNEERVLKNIITLSRELENVHTQPQMILSFEKQTDHALIFILILVYVVDQVDMDQFLKELHPIEVFIERKNKIGPFKETAVLNLKMKKTKDMLRKDLSVNIPHVREKIRSLIYAALGDIRDYEGGFFLKQQELFAQLQNVFPLETKEHKEFIESFFYSISPIEKQATGLFSLLKKFLALALSTFKENLPERKECSFCLQEEGSHLLIFIRADLTSLTSQIERIFNRYIPHRTLSTQFSVPEGFCIGGIFEGLSFDEQKKMFDELFKKIDSWKKERNEKQIMRLSLGDYPISLDPRRGGDVISKSILQLLFEGLMRMGPDDKPECALAQSVEISQNQKIYIFKLRDCKWSNGMEILAEDFVYSWKKILSPDFETPFAYHLYSIEKARAAKLSKLPLDTVGIHALDKKTLRIVLTRPVPYFLELLTLPVFFPIQAMHDQKYPHWPSTEGRAFVCNGPFRLKTNQNHTIYTLEKNPLYWDASQIHLKQIICLKTNIREAFEMFKKDEIDWVGRPLRPWHPLIEEMKTKDACTMTVDIPSYWCVLNVQSFPLTHLKLRQSLSLAINRKIFKEYFPNDVPAFSPLPFQYSQLGFFGIEEGEEKLACQLFEKALQELHLTRAHFPTLHFIYPEGEKREQIAKILIAQWKDILGITVTCQAYPWATLFHKVVQGDYELAGMGWVSLVHDSLYTFDVLTRANEPMNFPKWEHEEYQDLMEKVFLENHAPIRSAYLEKAEGLLIREVPVIPLLYEVGQAMKKNYVKIQSNKKNTHFRTASICK